jgi:hypothetical protein
MRARIGRVLVALVILLEDRIVTIGFVFWLLMILWLVFGLYLRKT